MSKKSMIEIAYDYLVTKNEPVTLVEIWNHIKKVIPEVNNQQIARFYTNLSLDGRFLPLGNNNWDLKAKYSLNKIKEINTNLLKVTFEDEDVQDGNPFEKEEEIDLDILDEDDEDAKDEDDEDYDLENSEEE